MRKDLQKLLCEQERHGSDRSYKEVRRKRDFSIDVNEFSAGRESMTKRYMIVGNNKEFSENFNPLFGIIRKNVNRPWDKVFSELNKIFDMRNHVNAHIVIHLFDFVERETFIGEDGEVWERNKYGPNRPIKDSGSEYYVHPVTGILLKNVHYKTYGAERRNSKARHEEEKRKLARKISDTLEYRRRTEDDPWFACTIAPFGPGKKVFKYTTGTYRSPLGRETTEHEGVWDAWEKKLVEPGWNRKNYCSSVRSASRKELLRNGIIDK